MLSAPLKVILCCTDFSPEAEHAVVHAVRLARATNATLILAHLVHVASGELLSHDPHGPTHLTLSEGRERALRQLADLRQRLAGDYGAVELEARFGAPAESAIALARERGADMIVTAVTDRHTHREVTDLLHESVTQTLIHQAPCPVLIVPPHAK
jgi:nucleotide-binding universal stress UspA family protein